MNPLVLYMGSGESLYSGAALLLALISITPYIKNRWLLRLRMLLIWCALGLMVMACPPLPYWLDGLFFAVFIGWLIAWGGIAKTPTTVRRRLRLASTTALTLFTLLLPTLELPRRRPPHFTGPQAHHLVVIGDSISAGIFTDKPWPDTLSH